MKKILVLTYNFWPDTSPTAYCLESVLKELSNMYSITVITSTKNKYHNENKNEIYNGVEVKRYFDKFAHLNEVIRINYKQSYGYRKKLWRILRVISSIINRLYYIIYPDGGYIWLKHVSKKIEETINLDEYSVIIPSIGLYTTQLLAKKIKIKNPYIKSIAYINDPLPINNPFITDNFHIFNSYKLSIECIKNSDIIIANSTLCKRYKSDIFKNYSSKIMELDIPLLIESKKNINEKFDFDGDKDKLKLVYTGSLYKNIRNPEVMLETLSKINCAKYTVHIIGHLNDCEEIVMRYKNLMPETFFIYGVLQRKDAIAAINSADVLINIGNDLSDQVPSKIFEYMGTGKPIIHYYTNPYDTCLNYLKKYQLFYGVIKNEKQNKVNEQELNDFILKSSNVCMPFECIKNRLRENTPQYSGEIIDKIFKMLEVK